MENKRAVVVGAGTMGQGIVALFLAGGWMVDWVVRDESRWTVARDVVAQAVNTVVAHTAKMHRLSFRRQMTDINWDGVAIIVESINENLKAKRDLFIQLDELVPIDTVIGSNSSSLRISDIANGCMTASRMANTHFFQPAHLVPLVEIAPGELTHPSALATLREIFESLRRVPVVLTRDVPGFLANRIQHALMREAFAALDEGLATPDDIDKAVTYGFGFRYVAAGPMLLKEFAGFDTQHAAASAIYPTLCNGSKPGKTLQALYDQGRFGVKSRCGLRVWTEEQTQLEKSRYEAKLVATLNILRGQG